MQPTAEGPHLFTEGTQVLVSQGWARPLRCYLPQSIVATVAVVAPPLLVLWVCTSVIYFEIPMLAVFLMAMSLGFVTAGVASEVWKHRPGAREISFSELLLWSWYRLQKADRRLGDSHRRLSEVDSSPEEQLIVLQELSDALESKDPYTRGHSSRVERHSFNIAVALGLSLKEIEVLRKAASLHDVGKMRIPNSVLHKPGKLDDDERALIEEHPVLGAWMVSSIGDEMIVGSVRHHHERWDGTGYPDRIRGNEIPLFARIIAVADTYDAVTSTRSYRAGGSRKRGLEIVKAESGKQFDPLVVEAFFTTLPARSPLIAGVALVAGPQLLWRHFMQWLQRFGAGAVAPGLGAVGAAVVLGASTFVAPGGPAREPGADARVVTSPANAERGAVSPALEFDDAKTVSSDRVLGKRITKNKTVDGRDGNKNRREAADRAERNGASASGSKSGSGGVRRQEADPKPLLAAPASDGQPKSNGTKTEMKAPNALPTADALDEIDDPSAQGADCDGSGAKSTGSMLHCDGVGEDRADAGDGDKEKDD